jgi:membrane protease YdiL (CAAX protease family)
MTTGIRAGAASGPALGMGQATAAVLGLGAVYTVLYTLVPDDTAGVFTHLLPGLLAVGALLLAGLSTEECFLRFAPPSGRSLALLALFSAAALAVVLPVGHWAGRPWPQLLVYAPVTALAQELYFRAALLPALLARLPRVTTAIVLQAVLFMAWHLPKAATSAPLWGAVAVAIVTLLGGLVWGRQVRRDRTIVYVLGFHALTDMAMALAPPA